MEIGGGTDEGGGNMTADKRRGKSISEPLVELKRGSEPASHMPTNIWGISPSQKERRKWG